MKNIRTTALLLILILSMLAGCTKKPAQVDTVTPSPANTDGAETPAADTPSPTAAANVPMGRYVEQTIDLDSDTAYIVSMHVDGDSIIFYAMDYNMEDQSSSYTRSVYRDGEVTTETVDILTANEDMQNVTRVSELKDGSLLVMHMDDTYQNYLLKRVVDGEVIAMDMPDWEAIPKDYDYSQGMPKRPADIIALDDSFLVLYMYHSVVQYDYEGNELRQFPVYTGSSGFAVNASQTELIALETQNTEVMRFDLATGEQLESFSFEPLLPPSSDRIFVGSGDVMIGYSGDKPIFATSSGISTYEDGEFTQLVDGSMTMMNMPSIAIRSMYGLEDEVFMMLQDNANYVFNRYYYREDIPTTPGTVMEIFALNDSPTIRQAMGTFRQEYPDVKINFRVALTPDTATTAEDVIRALNTEILAGKGPDLIVLDGMPIDSYIEKGVLKDITALLEKQAEAGNILENFKNTFASGNGIYGVPAKYFVPVMIGSADLLSQVNSVQDLEALVLEHQSPDNVFHFPPDNTYRYLYPYGDDSYMIMNYYDAVSDMFKDGNKINEEALAGYLESMINIRKAIEESVPETNIWDYGTIHIATSASAIESVNQSAEHLKNGTVSLDLYTMMGTISYGYSYQYFKETDNFGMAPMFNGKTYFPKCGVGVLSTGKNQQLAEKFVELLLSYDIQENALGDGFAVNEEALLKTLEEHTFGWAMRTDDSAAPDEDEEFDDLGFVDFIASLDKPVFVDSVVKNAVIAQLPGLHDDTLTPQDAARKVVESTRLYLAE